MNVLVIGSGMMGSALAYDLAHSDGVERVILSDKDEQRAKTVASSLGKNVSYRYLDVNSQSQLLSIMRDVEVVIGATSYTHNITLTKAAIEAKVHFCDLGGNMDVVGTQLALDAKARQANICVLPNCGIAPGMACVIAAGMAAKFTKVDSIHIRVGGLPQHPLPPLNYQLVFSAEGLINEYLEPADVIRDGKVQQAASMTDLEELTFPHPFNRLEAFNTSGGVSTLTKMFEGKVRELDYKTIRYPGHCDRFKTLLDLGFASSEPFTIGSGVRTAREIFEELLRRKLPANGPDVVLMRVTVSGTMSGSTKTLSYEMIDYSDVAAKLTSMMRTTSFPTSIIAQMVARGEITARGVVPPEQCVPLEPFIKELRKRKIDIHESIS